MGEATVALGERAWIITFADLISLLLTFTILLFTLSGAQRQAAREALFGLPPAPSAEEPAPPAVATAAPLRVRALLDLDYLALLLPAALAAEPALAEAQIQRSTGRLSVVLPMRALFDADSDTLQEPAARALTALSRSMGNPANHLAVLAVTPAAQAAAAEPPFDPTLDPTLDPGLDPALPALSAALSLALSRALAVQGALQQAGNALSIASWVLAESDPYELGDAAGRRPDTPGARLVLVVSADGGG